MTEERYAAPEEAPQGTPAEEDPQDQDTSDEDDDIEEEEEQAG